MTLLRAADISLSFGSRSLFSGLELVIEAGERVGLVGVNGCGKSTLMKVLAGAQKTDSGLLQLQRGARVVYLPQEPVFAPGATIATELNVAQKPLRDALAEHAALSESFGQGASDNDEKKLARMGELAEQIDRLGGWDTSHHAKKLLDRLGVKDWDRAVTELSGGNQKRVAIARALLSQSELLMLDEPTNHLDADTVAWLEDELDAREGALLLVTHDRYFLDGLVDRIVEVEDGKATSYPGNYEAYLEQKFVKLEEAESSQHKRNRWIAQEVAWLRRGPQARRTKSKARIERAHKLLAEKGFKRPSVAALQLKTAPRLSQTVIEAKKLSQGYGDKTVFSDFNFILQPGERVGLLGANGAGKTTLLRTLLGELKPRSGTVTLGPRSRVAYYDQTRTTLDPELTVYETAFHDDWVQLGDNKVRLSDYLEDLLFPVPMQRMKVAALSGGERNRLLLAKLFLEGANVLVLDEPTNDLDLVTLNVLERLILEFSGAVLLVTHDRYFLDKVATSLLVFEAAGSITRYEGNYSLYRKLRPAGIGSAPAVAVRNAPPPMVETTPSRKASKLSYKDQRELDGMEAAIEKAEGEKAALEAKLADPAVFSRTDEVARLSEELEKASAKVAHLYSRWDQLNALQG